MGHPPKVLWLQLGNRTTDEILDLIRRRRNEIAAFSVDGEAFIYPLVDEDWGADRELTENVRQALGSSDPVRYRVDGGERLRPGADGALRLRPAAIAYLVLQRAIIIHHGAGSVLARAVGKDFKGLVSPVLYLVAIPCAFISQWIAGGIYVLVALVWLIPDQRIERTLAEGR